MLKQKQKQSRVKRRNPQEQNASLKTTEERIIKTAICLSSSRPGPENTLDCESVPLKECNCVQNGWQLQTRSDLLTVSSTSLLLGLSFNLFPCSLFRAAFRTWFKDSPASLRSTVWDWAESHIILVPNPGLQSFSTWFNYLTWLSMTLEVRTDSTHFLDIQMAAVPLPQVSCSHKSVPQLLGSGTSRTRGSKAKLKNDSNGQNGNLLLKIITMKFVAKG